MAKIIGMRYGRRGPPIQHMVQQGPVYDRPPVDYGPLVVGGVCPPDMHIGRVSGGYSCVPGGAFGQDLPPPNELPQNGPPPPPGGRPQPGSESPTGGFPGSYVVAATVGVLVLSMLIFR